MSQVDHRHSRSSASRAWLAVLAGGVLAGTTLLVDGWRGAGLPADAVARVDDHPIARADWLRAVHAVESDRGRSLDAAERAQVLRRMIDEELLFQHAVGGGLVRNDPGLRKTVIAGLIDAATAGGAADDVAARALFERDPAYFAAQMRLRVAGLRLPAGLQAPPAAAILAAIGTGEVPAPLLPLDLPAAALPLPQLAQRLGGSATEALRHAGVGELVGPLPAANGALYLSVIERQADSPRYEDVAEAVRSELARRNAEAALDRLLQTLRRDTPIVISPDARG